MIMGVSVYGEEITVGTGGRFHSIREALQIAKEGDVINVHAGVYKEGELVITKSVSIKGSKESILDGEHKTSVLVVRANGVYIQGLTIRNSGYSDLHELSGIRLENVSRCRIEGNYFYDNYFGIYLANSRHCKILHNRVEGLAKTETSSGNGIHLWKSEYNLLIGNHVSGHRDGIYFEFVKHSAIISNLSELNLRYGLHFMFSDDDSYRFNIFRNNGSGVAVMYTRRVTMDHNRFEHNWGSAAYGLLLKEISYSRINNNTFSMNTTGLYMEGSNQTVVENNDFIRNGWGLRILGDCFDDSVRFNNFKGNTFEVATNAIRSMNVFYRNYWDQYRGYDLNHDQVGDIPYHPVSLYSKITEESPFTLMLLHSFFIDLMDQAEKVVPTITPEAFKDEFPLMKPLINDTY
ncbi:MAG: nitrous oxide reductase family maturation protein NosD [Bacteroidetes bacterium]|nr:nitrous oxide reductase family maturation protein NosD [Bacteroidota bacterium]MBL0066853.1 nitrous oxide reductase family maturation protein NosD [Bacteroidota bacterium]MBL0140241.1 nitrous oxide reductase family maturation protein NosD [Bacteroidota bacterium]